jgi:hypothetical protein
VKIHSLIGLSLASSRILSKIRSYTRGTLAPEVGLIFTMSSPTVSVLSA